LKKLINIIIVLSAIFILPEAQAQWTQQNLPVSSNSYDICFINSTTGFISLELPALYMTTDSGNNWIFKGNYRIYNMQFIDSLYGFANGRLSGNDRIYKTTNGGVSWDSVSIGGRAITYISFVNRDTGWICGHNGSLGAIYKTTDGGVTLIQQFESGTSGMDRIFFLKDRVNGEYTGWCSQANILRKTTNSGLNWFVVQTFPSNGLSGMFFLNKYIGWISYYQTSANPLIAKTTNGGNNWFTQLIDTFTVATNIFFIDSLKGWAGRGYSKLFATTNGGTNWGIQNVPIFSPLKISFTDSVNGWIAGGNGLAHTTNGGGPITYTGINHNNTSIPVNFTLEQNYPNPFNPSTNITFSLKTNSIVSLGIFDIRGKEILKIYNNEKLTAGNYISRLDFGKLNISSGVYFYKLEVSGINNNKLFSQTKKMIYSK
jgi:photosystem II stability/assembly factor-like uncharacterized protein